MSSNGSSVCQAGLEQETKTDKTKPIIYFHITPFLESMDFKIKYSMSIFLSSTRVCYFCECFFVTNRKDEIYSDNSFKVLIDREPQLKHSMALEIRLFLVLLKRS